MMQHSRAFSRALTRVLLALLLVTCMTMVFIGKCGLNLDQDVDDRIGVDRNNNNDDDDNDDVKDGKVNHGGANRGGGVLGGIRRHASGSGSRGVASDHAFGGAAAGVGRHPRSRGGVAAASKMNQRRQFANKNNHDNSIDDDDDDEDDNDDNHNQDKKGFLDTKNDKSVNSRHVARGDGGGSNKRKASSKHRGGKSVAVDESLLQLQETQQLQQQTDHLRHLLAQREELHRGEISKLRQQIEALRQQIADKSAAANNHRFNSDSNGDVGGGGKNQRGGNGGGGGGGGGGSPQHDFHNFVRQSGIEGPPPPQLSLLDEQRLVNSKVDINKFVDAKLEESEILHGQAMRTEYEVIPYNRFTLTRLFLVDPGLGRRVVEKPIGLRKKEILQVVAKGIEVLNHRHVLDDDMDDHDNNDDHDPKNNNINNHKNSSSGKNGKNNNNNNNKNVDLDDILQHTFVNEDFVEGIFRTEPGVGTHYELYFRSPKGGSLQEQPPIPDADALVNNNDGDKKHINKTQFYAYGGDVTTSPNLRGGGGGGVGVSTVASSPLSSSTSGTSSLDSSRLKKVTLFRPFAPLQLVQNSFTSLSAASASVVDGSSASSASAAHSSITSSTSFNDNNLNNKPWINLILPLSGRIDKFRSFMEKFVRICIKQDKRVYLTVVYFGEPGLKEVTNILGGISKMYSFKALKLVTVSDSTFSRGKGLQVGVEAWGSGSGAGAAMGGGGGGGGGSAAHKHKDVLMFLCDVDIIFNAEFLDRCRQNTRPGEKVYYPILFSLYNPNIVYSLHDVPIPPELEQLVISKDTGWWRDFGYGMTCQYRSDFLAIKGFDEEIQGWGGEDVGLYRKYVKSKRKVIRAVDPGIFHMWHEKNCDPNLSADQYRNCIRSKALNEASHAQLGLLAFKDEIDIHRSYLKKDEIKNIPQSKINR